MLNYQRVVTCNFRTTAFGEALRLPKFTKETGRPAWTVGAQSRGDPQIIDERLPSGYLT